MKKFITVEKGIVSTIRIGKNMLSHEIDVTGLNVTVGDIYQNGTILPQDPPEPPEYIDYEKEINDLKEVIDTILNGGDE